LTLTWSLTATATCSASWAIRRPEIDHGHGIEHVADAVAVNDHVNDHVNVNVNVNVNVLAGGIVLLREQSVRRAAPNRRRSGALLLGQAPTT
jgi:hypothetical protein